MQRKEHWEQAYTVKGERDVSWFELLPAISLQLMEAAGLTAHT